MYRINKKIINKISILIRRSILLGIDLILITISINFTQSINASLAQPIYLSNQYKYILLFSGLFFLITGQYKAISRYAGSLSFYKIIIRNLILVFFVGFLFIEDQILDLKFVMLTFLTLTFFSFGFRIILRDFINFFSNNKNLKVKEKVAIYGAGAAGAQLYNSLKLSGKYDVAFFIDDSPNLWNREINNIPIKSSKYIFETVSKINQILIAIPSLTKSRRREILKNLEPLGINVLQIPSLEYLASGNSNIDQLSSVQIEDLLCRERVKPKEDLLYKIKNSSILVTGAGGSIGRELCEQIGNLSPELLIIFDNNEYSLYEIDKSLRKDNKFKIITVLGDVRNEELLEDIFKSNRIDIIFHAAAYKHVPLLEINPIQAIENNIFSTKLICEKANKYGINKMILISSDKAVRPTNIMGVSKRISELIIQSYAQKNEEEIIEKTKNFTNFSMVRFGNVLGSSGSVVPLFTEQIKSGGPVTITNREINRYFMTISEAAELVIQASAIANGGEVLLLDMGKPVKIFDLAKQMIRLSGLKVRDQRNRKEDIEIVFTGLRPGEKLYEELLIDSNAEKTVHPLIFKSKEKMIKYETLSSKLTSLREIIEIRDERKLKKLLKEIVPEWTHTN